MSGVFIKSEITYDDDEDLLHHPTDTKCCDHSSPYFLLIQYQTVLLRQAKLSAHTEMPMFERLRWVRKYLIQQPAYMGWHWVSSPKPRQHAVVLH